MEEEEEEEDNKGVWRKAKLISTIGTQLTENEDEAENETEETPYGKPNSELPQIQEPDIEMTEEEAATLIQACYRGYKTRLVVGPLLEERLILLVDKHIDNPDEAEKALEEEGLSPEEAATIIQKFWGCYKIKREKQKDIEDDRYTNTKKMKNLIMFSQNVHLANQEVHKYLRRQKAGMRLDEVGPATSSYVRPRGFDDIPQLIREQRKKGPHQQPLSHSKFKASRSSSSAGTYYDMLQCEYRSTTPEFDAECSWDAPIASKFTSPTSESDRATPTTNMRAASDLRQMLRSSKTPLTRNPSEDQGEMGPYNFQQFLRKTNYAPTDTMRRRKEEKCPGNS